MLQFHHDRHVGEHFLEMYAGGERLFPPDPLAGVAAEILACREIPMDLVEAALESIANEPSGILTEHFSVLRKEISTLADQVSYRRLLTDQNVASLLADQEWHEKMLMDVKANWRLVRRVPISEVRTDDLLPNLVRNRHFWHNISE